MTKQHVLSQVKDHIEEIIEHKTPLGKSLLKSLEDIHPADIALFLGDLGKKESPALFMCLSRPLQAEVFEELSDRMKAFLLTAIDKQSQIIALNTLAADQLTDLFDHFSDEELKAYLNLLQTEQREEVLSLLQFDSESAGGIMKTDIITFMPAFTVERCISLLQRLRPSRDVHEQIYVVNRDDRLLGYVNLEDLVLQKPNIQIGSFMHKSELVAQVDEDRESVAKKMVHYGVMTVPVVNKEGLFVGVIPGDTLVDVLVEEASEDVQRMSALTPLKHAYFETPFLQILYERGSILAVLLIAGSISTFILRSFEATLTALLYQFIPMITSTGGNTSSQTSAIVIQGLATGDISFKNAIKFLRREIVMAVLLGTILGIVAFGRVYFTSGELIESIATGITIALIVLASVILGSCTPIILKRLNIDPAFSAGPFLATIMDVLGTIIFCMVVRIVFSFFLGT